MMEYPWHAPGGTGCEGGRGREGGWMAFRRCRDGWAPWFLYFYADVTCVHPLLMTHAIAGRYLINYVAALLITRIRTKYMAAVLSQDMEWHDKNPAAALDIRLTANVPKLQSAMGTKLQMCITNIGGGIGGLAFAFAYSWELTLVSLAGCIPLFASFGIMLSTIQQITEIRQKQYEKVRTRSSTRKLKT